MHFASEDCTFYILSKRQLRMKVYQQLDQPKHDVSNLHILHFLVIFEAN